MSIVGKATQTPREHWRVAPGAHQGGIDDGCVEIVVVQFPRGHTADKVRTASRVIGTDVLGTSLVPPLFPLRLLLRTSGLSTT